MPVDNQGQRSCFKGTSPAYGPGQEFHNRGQRDLGIEADARITRNVSYDPPVVISPQDQREVPHFCVGGADFWTRNHVTDFGMIGDVFARDSTSMLRDQPKHQQGSGRSGYEFDEKTDDANRRLATPTATAEAQPADDGNKVNRGQR